MDYIKIYCEDDFTEMRIEDKIILALVRDRGQYFVNLVKKVGFFLDIGKFFFSI